MKGVIYCYHCIPTGKKYIGQTLFETKRKAYHRFCSKKENTKFYRAVRKYGWDNFVYGVLEEFDKQILDEMEIFYIKKYNSFKNGYNSTMGGEGNCGRVLTEEEKEKSKNRMTFNNPMKDENTRKKVSEKLKGRKIPTDVIDKIIETRKNNPNGWNSQTMREKLSRTMKTKTGSKNSRYGKKHTEETKKIMSERQLGNTNVRGKKWWNNGQINKMSVECPGEHWVPGRCPKK